MSWDVYLEEAVVDRQSFSLANPTFNLQPMFLDALRMNFRDLDGKPAPLAAEICEVGLHNLRTFPDRFKALNPANGWGDYDGAIDVLTWIRDACLQHPEGKLSVQ